MSLGARDSHRNGLKDMDFRSIFDRFSIFFDQISTLQGDVLPASFDSISFLAQSEKLEEAASQAEAEAVQAEAKDFRLQKQGECLVISAKSMLFELETAMFQVLFR